MGCGLKLRFEVIGQVVATCEMASFGIESNPMVSDFKFGFGQAVKIADVEKFGFEAASKAIGVRVVVAVAAPAHALPNALTRKQMVSEMNRLGSCHLNLGSIMLNYRT